MSKLQKVPYGLENLGRLFKIRTVVKMLISDRASLMVCVRPWFHTPAIKKEREKDKEEGRGKRKEMSSLDGSEMPSFGHA